MTDKQQTAVPAPSDDPAYDWTAKDGRSNSSDEYLAVVAHVERLIRDDAYRLIAGRADDTARLIVSQLAHKYAMRPDGSVLS